MARTLSNVLYEFFFEYPTALISESRTLSSVIYRDLDIINCIIRISRISTAMDRDFDVTNCLSECHELDQLQLTRYFDITNFIV